MSEVAVSTVGPTHGTALIRADAYGSLLEGTMGRITVDPDVLGGVPTIRGMRIPVATVLRRLAVAGTEIENLLDEFPYLERDDILAALAYAADVVEARQPGDVRATPARSSTDREPR